MRKISYVWSLAACATLLLGVCGPASAQKIKGHYVSKVQQDGTIYHTFPKTLFSDRDAGEMTFDVTYKTRQDGTATVNFTYYALKATPADSARFRTEAVTLSGPVEQIYIEPDKKRWMHRYTMRVRVDDLARFFDREATPDFTLYTADGHRVVYHVQRSAWRDYAPVAYRIFEMIRYNETE